MIFWESHPRPPSTLFQFVIFIFIVGFKDSKTKYILCIGLFEIAWIVICKNEEGWKYREMKNKWKGGKGVRPQNPWRKMTPTKPAKDKSSPKKIANLYRPPLSFIPLTTSLISSTGISSPVNSKYVNLTFPVLSKMTTPPCLIPSPFRCYSSSYSQQWYIIKARQVQWMGRWVCETSEQSHWQRFLAQEQRPNSSSS